MNPRTANQREFALPERHQPALVGRLWRLPCQGALGVPNRRADLAATSHTS